MTTLLAVACVDRNLSIIASNNQIWKLQVVKLLYGDRIHVGIVHQSCCAVNLYRAVCMDVAHYIHPLEFWKDRDVNALISELFRLHSIKLVYRGILFAMMKSARKSAQTKTWNRLQQFAMQYETIRKTIQQS